MSHHYLTNHGSLAQTSYPATAHIDRTAPNSPENIYLKETKQVKNELISSIGRRPSARESQERIGLGIIRDGSRFRYWGSRQDYGWWDNMETCSSDPLYRFVLTLWVPRQTGYDTGETLDDRRSKPSTIVPTSRNLWSEMDWQERREPQ